MRRPTTLLLSSLLLVVGAGGPSAQKRPPSDRAGIVARFAERMKAGGIDHPFLRRQQRASLAEIYWNGADPVILPADDEVARYREMRKQSDAAALDYLDEFYGTHDELKALALRDSDGDGVPDFRISDYFGKFMEGDVDVDGDGIRNVLDSHPFDRARGGEDVDGDGQPDRGHPDDNGNGIPDPVDWSGGDHDAEAVAIQQALFGDHKILLVDRDAVFDLALAQAVDDTVRRVFRGYFDERPVLPTLRTIATERTALLTERLAAKAEDDTSAQVFPQTQSLIVYDQGRAVAHRLGLLGLLVHEMGHTYHMSLDFDESNLVAENGRVDFPAPAFVALVKPFGWTTTEYFDGDISGALTLAPRFVYAGMSEPVFRFRDRTPEEWQAWVDGVYEDLDESPTYLLADDFSRQGIVGDYSLSTPYEWYGDNFLAYVVTVIEEEALRDIDPADREEAKARTDQALREIWPSFYHRNQAADVRRYFEETFPIADSDRQFLAARYIQPIVQPASDTAAGPAANGGPGRLMWLLAIGVAVLVVLLVRARTVRRQP
jgi:hypothetical protein